MIKPRSPLPSMLQIASDLVIPLEAITQTFAILAKRGSGKTYCALVMVEEMVKAGLPVVVIDPVGVCWGLRTASDGVSPGLPIAILGGDHGDLAIAADMGDAIAQFVAEQNSSLVLDLSNFSGGEMTKFITDFAETLYHKNRNPLHLVVDEADAFIPQKPLPGEQRMLGAMDKIVRRGRARGLGITVVTQRPAVIHKNVLTQLEVLIALRIVSPQDRKAIESWIEVHGTLEERDTLMKSLASLPIGTAWVWSPGWLDVFQKVKIRQRETFDSSATPTIEGERPIADKVASVNLEALKLQLNQTLKKTAKNSEQKPETLTQAIEVPVPVFQDGQVERLEATAQSLIETSDRLLATATEIISLLQRVQTPDPPLQPQPEDPRLSSPSRSKQSTAVATEVEIAAGAKRILGTLGKHYPVKMTRVQLGTLSNFTASGGTFQTYLSTLKKHDLIVETGGLLQITEAGTRLLGFDALPQPKTAGERLALWRNALQKGERRLFDELMAAGPQGLARQELGDRSGYTHTGGTFGTYLSTLRRNGLVFVNGDRVCINQEVLK